MRGVKLAVGEPPQHARLADPRVAQHEQPEQHIVLFGHDTGLAGRGGGGGGGHGSFIQLAPDAFASPSPRAAFKGPSDVSPSAREAAPHSSSANNTKKLIKL